MFKVCGGVCVWWQCRGLGAALSFAVCSSQNPSRGPSTQPSTSSTCQEAAGASQNPAFRPFIRKNPNTIPETSILCNPLWHSWALITQHATVLNLQSLQSLGSISCGCFRNATTQNTNGWIVLNAKTSSELSCAIGRRVEWSDLTPNTIQRNARTHAREI